MLNIASLQIIEMAKTFVDQDVKAGLAMPNGVFAHFEDIYNRLTALTGASASAAPDVAAAPAVSSKTISARLPAIDPRASVTDDYLVCLIDGTKHTMLKRYLKRVHNMEWSAYLTEFGLPHDYPSVTRNYSETRRDSAILHGLGHHKQVGERIAA